MLASHFPPQFLPCNLPLSPQRHARNGYLNMDSDHEQQQQQQQQNQRQQQQQHNPYPVQQNLQYPSQSNISAPQWLPDGANAYYSSHHSLPTDDFTTYTFASAPASSSPPPSTSIGPHYVYQPHPSFDQRQPQPHQYQQQYEHQQSQQSHLQHAAYQWPSALAEARSAVYPSAQTQMGSAQFAPQPAGSSAPQPPSQSGPRRTLTDADRRRMCLYHEENPTKKQTEIGEIFGVERSTVSKVLRQKEKYLATESAATDESRSPLRRTKPRMPDLDRTLAKWAQNQQSRGIQLTDDRIRNQARMLRAASGASQQSKDAVDIESDSWLERFKQKNNIGPRASMGGPSSRMTSPMLRHRSSATFSTPLSDSTIHSPPAAAPMATSASHDSLQNRYIAHRDPSQTHSTPSLSSGIATDNFVTSASTTESPVFSPRSVPPGLGLSHESHVGYLTADNNDNHQRRHTVPNQLEASEAGAGGAYYPSPQAQTDLDTSFNSQAQGQMHLDMPPPPSLSNPNPLPPHPPPLGQGNVAYAAPSLADARLGLSTALTFLNRADYMSRYVGGADIGAMRRVYEQLMIRGSDNENEALLQGSQDQHLASIREQ